MPILLPPNAPDWSAEELAEIDRLKASCEASVCWETNCSHTDEGEPWCAVFDREAPDAVLVHIARIDRRYVVVWPQGGRTVTTTSIKAAVDLAVAEVAPDLQLANGLRGGPRR
jgi:hypothetical protein